LQNSARASRFQPRLRHEQLARERTRDSFGRLAAALERIAKLLGERFVFPPRLVAHDVPDFVPAREPLPTDVDDAIRDADLGVGPIRIRLAIAPSRSPYTISAPSDSAMSSTSI
jgi:hypothetical protein